MNDLFFILLLCMAIVVWPVAVALDPNNKKDS